MNFHKIELDIERGIIWAYTESMLFPLVILKQPKTSSKECYKEFLNKLELKYLER